VVEHNFILLQRLRRTLFTFKCTQLIDNKFLVHLLFNEHVETLLRLVAYVGRYHCMFIHVMLIVFEDFQLL